ncbi:MAG: AAA family ATPase [Desulfobacterales bacterium]|nr:AAA family ATPase [Desulfobacterales bacterium]
MVTKIIKNSYLKGKPPVGYSDFKNLREQELYYVDKSLLIEKIWENSSQVLLIPRPRRFGKTLNLSMLRYFFEKTEDSNASLFEGLLITKNTEIMDSQGKYPLIYLTFKDIKENSWEDCIEKLKLLISMELRRHTHLFEKNLYAEEVRQHALLLNHDAGKSLCEQSLFLLMQWINRATGSKIIVLIDEYDTPIHAGHQYGYYDEIILFMRNLLSGAFKDNSYLKKGVITGILRVSKESIFTGLNNIEVHSILSSEFDQEFGFTETEIEKILTDFKVENPQEIKDWYNGYIFGKHVIYNPWSILNYLNRKERLFQPFWLDSSSNDIVRDLIMKGPISLRENVETLLRGESICSALIENVVLRDIAASEENIWSLLTFSGYLKPVFSYQEDSLSVYKLSIPNREVSIFYRQTIQHWLTQQIGDQLLQKLLKALLKEDISSFEQYLSEMVTTVLSYHDTSAPDPERVYHAFVLGLLVNLSSKYQVRSNREAGYGRYDVMLIPKNPKQIGFIFEFKKVDQKYDKTPKTAMKSALKQISDKEYAFDLRQAEVEKILGIGIVVHNKKVWVQSVEL